MKQTETKQGDINVNLFTSPSMSFSIINRLPHHTIHKHISIIPAHFSLYSRLFKTEQEVTIIQQISSYNHSRFVSHYSTITVDTSAAIKTYHKTPNK